MKDYLAAHDDLIAWLDQVSETPPPETVEERLWWLALTAADRGMSSTHWTFVVDGLIAHVNRSRPGNTLLSSYVARGFDLASRWSEVRSEANTSSANGRPRKSEN
jgi:hypothetical protein